MKNKLLSLSEIALVGIAQYRIALAGIVLVGIALVGIAQSRIVLVRISLVWIALVGLALIPNPVQAENAISAPFNLVAASEDLELSNAFHPDARFAGADGACSIPLDEKSTVWLFGDTFVRKYASPKGQHIPTKEGMAFINNSAAVQNIDSKTMMYSWRKNAGEPAALLIPVPASSGSNSAAYYWPGDGFVLDEKLFILNKVIVPKKSDGKNPNNLNFDWVADDLSCVRNAGAEPSQWKYSSTRLQAGSTQIHIGTASLLKDDYVYFYTSIKSKVTPTHPHPTGVARVPVKVLLEGLRPEKFEFWNGDAWGHDYSKSAILFADGASEMTVTELDGEPYLVATYMPPLSSQICMRFSKRPEGPWSEPIKVFECPEARIKVLGRPCSVYSAKAHPEFAKAKDEVVVSYCSNPGDFAQFQARPDLYYPHIVRIRLDHVSR
ncbi:MAG TPA: DUF4185 domain-containing protein [Drouetiella sp.]